MMKVQLRKLESGTEFSYNGITYIIGTKSWSHYGAQLSGIKYFGNIDLKATLMSCHPRLGGKFQKKIEVWFNDQTEITITAK